MQQEGKEMEQERKDIRAMVWETANKILESGRYPTRNDICAELKKSSKTIGSYFAEWRKENPKPQGLSVQRGMSINNGSANGSSNGTREQRMSETDQESQFVAARKVVASHYYEKTQEFTVPGLKEQVSEALEQIDEYAISQEPGPLEMLDWLMAKSQS
jgi:hypothetical protein